MKADDLTEQFQDLPLRRDAMAFLNYIGDRELKLTTKKNLTLKDVRAINDVLVNPAELDERIGDNVHSLRTEEQARYIFWLRTVLQVAHLLKIRQGKISQTRAAKRFLARPPVEEIVTLFDAWWNDVNWAYFSQYLDGTEELQQGRMLLGRALLAIPAGERVELRAFADAQLRAMGLVAEPVNGEPPQAFTDHFTVAAAVIWPLERFGALVSQKTMLTNIRYLVTSFEVTDLGRYLLSQQTARFGPPRDRGNGT